MNAYIAHDDTAFRQYAGLRFRSERVSTGIPGLDDILGGGFDPDRIYRAEGQPGTGKTTLALHYLLRRAPQRERPQPGDAVAAVIKSTDVMIFRD